MNRSWLPTAVLLAACFACGRTDAGEAPPPDAPPRDAPAVAPAEAASENPSLTVWQLSPNAMFAAGSYAGLLSTSEVRRQGDLGVGAADSLNGEMILLDGRFYRFLSGGAATEVTTPLTMPFAIVTQWAGASRPLQVEPGLDYLSTFRTRVDGQLATRNAFYAVRITGRWPRVQARTFLKQTPPYRPLACADVSAYTFTDVQGTMVGFIAPSYADSLSVPDYHLHFLTADGKQGGHVTNFQTGTVQMSVAARPELTLRMPPPVRAPDTAPCPTGTARMVEP
jgi:acetolactate decarboxylase